MFCSECGKEISNDAAFCKCCGNSVSYGNINQPAAVTDTASQISENLIFCRNCGGQISVNTLVCPHCGVPVQENINKAKNTVNDEGGFSWKLLGFLLGLLIPIVAIVLYFCWCDSHPKAANDIAAGAWLGFFTGVLVVIIFFAVIVGFYATIFNNMLAYYS